MFEIEFHVNQTEVPTGQVAVGTECKNKVRCSLSPRVCVRRNRSFNMHTIIDICIQNVIIVASSFYVHRLWRLLSSCTDRDYVFSRKWSDDLPPVWPLNYSHGGQTPPAVDWTKYWWLWFALTQFSRLIITVNAVTDSPTEIKWWVAVGWLSGGRRKDAFLGRFGSSVGCEVQVQFFFNSWFFQCLRVLPSS